MEQLSVSELNDDCLLLVLKFLDLKDQISAALASQRFRALLVPLWQRKYRCFSTYEIGPIDDRDLHVLMKFIRKTVKIMRLKPPYKPYDISPYNYPSVKILKLNNTTNFTDDNLLEMTKLFPNLRSFIPYWGKISGKHIDNWQHLKDLNMRDCYSIEFDNIEKVLENLQLKRISFNKLIGDVKWKSEHAFKQFCNLEEICLLNDQLGLLTNLSQFTNLKVLSIINLGLKNTCYDNLVMDVAENRRNDLVELHANRGFPLNNLFVATFENLTKITINWRLFSWLNNIHRYAPNLREIVGKVVKDDDRSLCLNSFNNVFDNEKVTLRVEDEAIGMSGYICKLKFR